MRRILICKPSAVLAALLALLPAAAVAGTPCPDPTAEPEPAGSVASPALGPGTHTLCMEYQGRRRPYLVHIPPSREPGRPLPLVLAFHGGGGHAALMADDRRYGLLRATNRDGYVVVFPNGYSKFPRGRLATWNAGACCGDARDRDSDDVGYTRALVARVQARLNIDATRIHAIGMSNGGMMAHRLACDAADLFRAVAAVAGTDATRQCAPSRPVSVLHIHARDDTHVLSNGGMMAHRLACEAADLFRGVAAVAGTDATRTCNPSRPVSVLQIHARDDTHVLFDGGAGTDAFRDHAKVMDFVSVPETMARWTRRNQCAGAPRRTVEAAGAYCDTWSGCAGHAQVQLCVTDHGGHSWPGAQRVRIGKQPASKALDANTVIWRFFSSLPPP